jgi:hypothetical protein
MVGHEEMIPAMSLSTAFTELHGVYHPICAAEDGPVGRRLRGLLAADIGGSAHAGRGGRGSGCRALDSGRARPATRAR